ncbi:hypothetical protein EV586_1044 [Tumebacillus sp. BK434]|uniref:hypothetical protein n=1 Tax=Tumebacillus sp. BK434 TaxID=2512169 RepID=UPI0010528B0F|nr:hypothetical protein [Tumebacillus sp. BK434]TCP54387.1 hypothetical protein EV586_1044 [Tumebacillus sp. BK434]
MMKKTVGIFLGTALMAATLTGVASAAKEVLPESVASFMQPVKGMIGLDSITCSSAVNTQIILTKGEAWATSDTSAMMDYVYAKVSIYNPDGSFVNSGTDAQYYTTHAGASAADTSAWVFDDYAKGSHRYEKTGYNTVTHTTTKNF